MDKVATGYFESPDAKGCYILKFHKVKGSLPLLNMICVVDVNQFENIGLALANAFTKVMTKTNLVNIQAAEEGTEFDIIFSRSEKEFK